MIHLRLEDQLVELPTAIKLSESGEHVFLTDEAGLVVARFDKRKVLAWSFHRDKLELGLERLQQVSEPGDGGRDGH